MDENADHKGYYIFTAKAGSDSSGPHAANFVVLSKDLDKIIYTGRSDAAYATLDAARDAARATAKQYIDALVDSA